MSAPVAPVRPERRSTPVTRKAAPERASGGRLPEPTARDRTRARLATFAALAAYGTAHWALLVDRPSPARTAAVVAVAVSGAAALAVLPRLALGRLTRQAAAGLLALTTLMAGLLAAGLELRLLLPKGWAELADGLDRGLSGIRTVGWPYSGEEEWIRLAILLGAPLLLGLAAALAFWPARRAAGPLRAAALVVLLVLYGTAVTEHDPGAPLLRGLGLLALVSAWLWLPRLERREALAGAAVVACVGLVALPLAAGLDGDRPWWDYRAWHWFGGESDVRFDWEHSYGPLDWPRDGATLLQVRSERPHYWKTQTLDRFDGFRWIRSRDNDYRRAGADLPPALRPPGERWDYHEYNPRWDHRFRVTVRSLRSDLVLGAGTVYDVRGAGTVTTAADGTSTILEGPLDKGDSYLVRSYEPDPSAAQMRGADEGYPGHVSRYTAVFLPRPDQAVLDGAPARDPAAEQAREPVYMPLRAAPLTGSAGAERRVAASPYARVLRLARRLTAGHASSYDAVKAVERYLQGNLAYSERPPAREFPLAAFLFEDRIGYCQQFSGAMALMLRMAGIPSRVAAGFTEGSFNREKGEYRVRDLDAHSWVEVYFTGIGWVPFDPTPSAAPAVGERSAAQASGVPRGDAGDVRGVDGGSGPEAATGDRSGEGGGGPRLLLLLGLALPALAVAGAYLLLRRARAGPDPDLGEAQLHELVNALRRLGWRLPPGVTLLALERRLAGAAGPRSARYAAALRARRYDPGRPPAPAAADRRALRRELAAGGGVRRRLTALIAIPPRPRARRPRTARL